MTAPTKPEPTTESFARPSYFTKTSRKAAAERAEAAAPQSEPAAASMGLPPGAQIVHVDVDDQRPGWFARFATWVSRTLYLLIFVVAVGIAAAASVHAWDLRAQHDDDTARITALEAQIADATRDGERDGASLADAQNEITKLEAEVTAADKRAEDAEAAADAYRATLVNEQSRSAD